MFVNMDLLVAPPFPHVRTQCFVNMDLLFAPPFFSCLQIRANLGLLYAPPHSHIFTPLSPNV